MKKTIQKEPEAVQCYCCHARSADCAFGGLRNSTSCIELRQKFELKKEKEYYCTVCGKNVESVLEQ